MENETWLSVKEFPEYQVSSFGRVKNKMGKFLKPSPNPRYLNINFRGKHPKTLHRVLMITFKPIDGCENLVVNHIDGDKFNNNLSNLEWTTPKKNSQHAQSMGLYETGSNRYNSKLDDKKALEIKKLYKNPYTALQLAKKYQISDRLVYSIAKGERWKHIQ